MKFSVIMPCHNAGRWIGGALRSVAAQTHPAHEVIVIDDRSTDDSIEQVRRTGVPVVLVRSDAGNAAAARNVGIRAATGDWVAMLDADDEWLPQHLERIRSLCGDTDDVAYASGFEEMNADGRTVRRLAARLEGPRTGLTHEDFLRIREIGFAFGHLTMAYARRRVLEVGLFDPALTRRHDFDLWLRVIHGRTWTCDPQVTARYRLSTPGSISSNWASANLFAHRVLVKNEPAYQGPVFTRMIQVAARHAMSGALTHGDRGAWDEAKSEVWRHLTGRDRLWFAIAEKAPGFAARILRARTSRRNAKRQRENR